MITKIENNLIRPQQINMYSIPCYKLDFPNPVLDDINQSTGIVWMDSDHSPIPKMKYGYLMTNNPLFTRFGYSYSYYSNSPMCECAFVVGYILYNKDGKNLFQQNNSTNFAADSFVSAGVGFNGSSGGASADTFNYYWYMSFWNEEIYDTSKVVAGFEIVTYDPNLTSNDEYNYTRDGGSSDFSIDLSKCWLF